MAYALLKFQVRRVIKRQKLGDFPKWGTPKASKMIYLHVPYIIHQHVSSNGHRLVVFWMWDENKKMMRSATRPQSHVGAPGHTRPGFDGGFKAIRKFPSEPGTTKWGPRLIATLGQITTITRAHGSYNYSKSETNNPPRRLANIPQIVS